MSIDLAERQNGKILYARVSGRLSQADYDHFVPHTERLIQQHGKIRMLVEMDDLDGAEGAALWRDLKFDAKHRNDIERLAVVGDKSWHKWMTEFAKPFTSAEVRYFDRADKDQASLWLEAGPMAAPEPTPRRVS